MQNEIVESDGTKYESFTCTPEELFRLVKTEPANEANRRNWRGMIGKLKESASYRKWVGASYDEIANITSWPQGREIMQRYAADLGSVPAPTSIRRARKWSNDGDDFSRDRFDSGLDECWASRKRVHRPATGKVLSISIGFGGNLNRTAEQLAWTGAAAAVLVDRLENAGYACELTAVLLIDAPYPRRRESRILHRVSLKKPSEPLDIDRLLLVSACPAFFRFHTFRAILENQKEIDGSLGVVSNDVPASVRGDVHFPAAYSFEAAQSALSAILASIETDTLTAAV